MFRTDYDPMDRPWAPGNDLPPEPRRLDPDNPGVAIRPVPCTYCRLPVWPGGIQRDRLGRPYHPLCWLYQDTPEPDDDDDCPF